jgi:predicted AlkP superfamily pyrophosphatase or phosphodiesterase
MKKILILLAFISFAQLSLFAQEAGNKIQPRLVIGIVVDQMRYDYLYRFYDQYGEKGFKRLLREGMNFTFAQYNYIPTYTGPGHSSIYTGSVPYYHGIISNDWYDKKLRKTIYCVYDDSVKTVGADNSSGKMSPKNLLATTMTDQIRMSNNGCSKVYSISIKDRAAVLPGGHMANAVYWYDGKSGNFVSSTYYLNALPDWVMKFNDRKLPVKLMSNGWQLEKNKNYAVSLPDDGPGEKDVFKEGKTTFPHEFAKLPDSKKLDAIRSTPFGNELLADFLTALLKNEKPGKGKYCDFIAISFSSTDYVGHAYGPNSVEIMDTYLKLDKQIARILDTLDLYVGKGNYLLFLTADHAVKPNAKYLEASRIPADDVDEATVKTQLTDFCRQQFGNPHVIEALQDNQIYLDHQVMDSLKLDLKSVNDKLISFIRQKFPFISTVLTKEQLITKEPTRSMNSFILNGFNIRRSGDILFEMTPNVLLTDPGESATSHASSYDYDTHVPLMFFGWHVKPGESNQEVFVEDIAPTVCNLIHIQEPDATIGVPVIK